MLHSACSHPLCQKSFFVCAHVKGCFFLYNSVVRVCWSHRSSQATPLLPADGVWRGEGGHGGRHWDRYGHSVSLPTRWALPLFFVCETQTQKRETSQSVPFVHDTMLMHRASKWLTSVQGSETELSISVQLLQTRWSGAGMKNIVLLVPWSLIVKWQLALYIQVWNRYNDGETKHFNFLMMTQGSNTFDDSNLCLYSTQLKVRQASLFKTCIKAFCSQRLKVNSAAVSKHRQADCRLSLSTCL